jgi:isopenicillin N synthase-like dioxygenase
MRLIYRKVLEHLEVALELPTGALQALDSAEAQHRLKLVKYFPVDGISASTGQGVGAHQDETGWLTFVSEVDAAGLQIHMRNGKSWIEIPIGSNSWALNIGYTHPLSLNIETAVNRCLRKAFERATSGRIHATLHRVQVWATNTFSGNKFNNLK